LWELVFQAAHQVLVEQMGILVKELTDQLGRLRRWPAPELDGGVEFGDRVLGEVLLDVLGVLQRQIGLAQVLGAKHAPDPGLPVVG
jgi:hypothetical protein